MADLNDLTKDFQIMDKDFHKKKVKLIKNMGENLKGKIQDNTPVDTGKLINSYEIRDSDDSIEVYSNLEYAQYVDEGHASGHSFVPGRHMYELGMMQFESESDDMVDAFLHSVKGVGN